MATKSSVETDVPNVRSLVNKCRRIKQELDDAKNKQQRDLQKLRQTTAQLAERKRDFERAAADEVRLKEEVLSLKLLLDAEVKVKQQLQADLRGRRQELIESKRRHVHLLEEYEGFQHKITAKEFDQVENEERASELAKQLLSMRDELACVVEEVARHQDLVAMLLQQEEEQTASS